MAGRGVKCSRRRCDYGCGGRHAHARAVVCPCLRTPSFVHAVTTGGGRHVHVHRTHRRFACACARLVRLCLRALSFVHAGVVAGIHAHAHALFACARARPCSSVPAHAAVPLCSFVLVSIRLLVPVCPWPFVSTRLCLSPLPGCACLAFARAHWCSLGFVCAGSAFVRAHLGLFMLDGVGSERKRAD